MKLKWKVGTVPTGRYRSFETRAWPSAEFENGKPACCIQCKDEYRPPDVKLGKHEELTILVCDYSSPSNPETGKGFTWVTLKRRCATLQEAKDLAQKFFEANPSYLPKGERYEQASDAAAQ